MKSYKLFVYTFIYIAILPLVIFLVVDTSLDEKQWLVVWEQGLVVWEQGLVVWEQGLVVWEQGLVVWEPRYWWYERGRICTAAATAVRGA